MIAPVTVLATLIGGAIVGALTTVASRRRSGMYAREMIPPIGNMFVSSQGRGNVSEFACNGPLDPNNPAPYTKVGSLIAYPITPDSKTLDLFERQFGQSIVYRVIDPATTMQISFDATQVCVTCVEAPNDFSNTLGISQIGKPTVRQVNDKDIVKIPFMGGQFQVRREPANFFSP